ncbi:MAG: hypothetical protein ACOWWR_17660 [Eubacteriales bacterium]
MIYLCISTYDEAIPFIQEFNLKKDVQSCKFQIFKKDEVVLIISGRGKVSAAIAVTYLLSKHQRKDSDILINIGICIDKKEIKDSERIYLVNKIIDQDMGKTFYPDMLFKHPFQEIAIQTDSLLSDKEDHQMEEHLSDMEASGIYQGATRFLKSHQVVIIKVTSYEGINHKKLIKDRIMRLMEEKAKEIIPWIIQVRGFSCYKHGLTHEDFILAQHVAKNLKLTSTISSQLEQLLTYYKLRYGDITNLMREYAQIECKTKNEGKRIFAELKGRLF